MLKRVMVGALAGAILAGASFASEEITEKEFTERECLAEALFFEAGNQPLLGILGVAEVIFNRVKSERYPNTVCGVVHQGLSLIHI